MEVHRLIMDIQTWTLKAHERFTCNGCPKIRSFCLLRELVCNRLFGLSPYSNPYPPAWVLAEILPLGVMTNIYSNIKDKKIKKRIAHTFGLHIAPFESWMTIVTLTRNSCCHHARVWNKQNTIRPMIPVKLERPWIVLPTDTLRIYFDLCIIKFLLDAISPNNDMLKKLLELFNRFPEIDLAALRFSLLSICNAIKNNWIYRGSELQMDGCRWELVKNKSARTIFRTNCWLK